MSDNPADPTNEPDQDSEPTMMAPPEGRPDGTVSQSDEADGGGPHASDADDQLGSESPTS